MSAPPRVAAAMCAAACCLALVACAGLNTQRLQNADAHYRMATASQQQPGGIQNEVNRRAAYPELTLAIKLDSGNAQYRQLLGALYFYGQDFASAERETLLALEMDPQLAEAHNNLGLVLGASDSEGHGISREYGARLIGAKDIVLEEDRPERSGTAKAVGSRDEAWGKVLIGASGPGEQSWESDSLNNSIFTYYYLDGLNRHNGSVQQAFQYSKPLVYQRVKQEKGGDIDQNPQVVATNQNWNMQLSSNKPR